MLTTILSTVVVLGVLIFVHELGHFVAAKLVDIEVLRFSIGLGPKLWGFRRGETEYVISWFPLGGYVKMAGMEEMERIEGGKAEPDEKTGLAGATDLGLTTEAPEDRKPGLRDFESKSLPARFFVISAGVLMNFLFAVLVFAASAFFWGIERVPEARVPAVAVASPPAGADGLAAVPPGSRIVAVGERRVDDWSDVVQALRRADPGPVTVRFDAVPAATIRVPADDSARVELIRALDPLQEPVVRQVVRGSPAEAAGLQPGDRVLAVAGAPVQSWPEVVEAVRARPGAETALQVERAGRVLTVSVTPERQTVVEAEGQERTVGRIGAGATPREEFGLLGALAYGAERTVEVTGIILESLRDLFTGRESPRSLGGPILIGQISGEVARLGLEAFLNFMALLSVNLAVLNLLPIPILDGGHLLFLGVEAIRGRALSLEQRMRFTQVGFVIVVAIMVWALANDMLRLFGL